MHGALAAGGSLSVYRLRRDRILRRRSESHSGSGGGRRPWRPKSYEIRHCGHGVDRKRRQHRGTTQQTNLSRVQFSLCSNLSSPTDDAQRCRARRNSTLQRHFPNAMDSWVERVSLTNAGPLSRPTPCTARAPGGYRAKVPAVFQYLVANELRPQRHRSAGPGEPRGADSKDDQCAEC